VPYRTTAEEPTFQSLTDPAGGNLPGGRPFPTALDPFVCNRYEMAAFAEKAYGLNVLYLGGCCGSAPQHIRAIAGAAGRRPEARRDSPDRSKHNAHGGAPSHKQGGRDNPDQH
jgi:betaine-homocysteine S-methyltransferase